MNKIFIGLIIGWLIGLFLINREENKRYEDGTAALRYMKTPEFKRNIPAGVTISISAETLGVKGK